MDRLDDAALDRIFRTARTYNGYTDTPVGEDELRAIWDLMKWGPTSANQLPARLLWCTTDESKAKLAECVSAQNAPKILKAPVSVIIGDGPRISRASPDAVPACRCESLVRW